MCVYLYLYLYIYIYTYIYTSKRMYVYMYMYMHTHTQTHTHAYCVYVCMRESMQQKMCAFVCVWVLNKHNVGGMRAKPRTPNPIA